MSRQLSQREQKILIITIGLAVIYLTNTGIIKPLKERIGKIDSQITIEQSRIHKNLRIVNKAKAQDRLYREYENRYKQEKSNEEIMSAMLSDIEQAASDLNLRITDMKPKKVKNEDVYQLFSLSLKIDSHLKDIIRFLYLIQSDPYVFEVETIRFDKGSRKKSKSLKANLILSKIYIP